MDEVNDEATDIRSAGLSPEQLDYIREMMNIAAGNAATALTQMVKREVRLTTPRASILPTPQAFSFFADPLAPAVCVKMMMIGDAGGYILFIVPQEHERRLVELLTAATPGTQATGTDEVRSTVSEIGNIIAGVYLTAIHDFSDLNIYHTVVVSAHDTLRALLDEPLAVLSSEQADLFLVENEFTIAEESITAYLLLIPFLTSLVTVAGSLRQARRKMLGG